MCTENLQNSLFFQQKLLLKYELFKKDPTTIWDEDQEHDLTIKQANGEDLPFAIPWRDVYKVKFKFS